MITEMLKSQLHRELRESGFKACSVKQIYWTKCNADSFSVGLNVHDWTFDVETFEAGFSTGDYSPEGVQHLITLIRGA